MPSSRSFSHYASLLHQLSELDMLFFWDKFFSQEKFFLLLRENVTWSSAIPVQGPDTPES